MSEECEEYTMLKYAFYEYLNKYDEFVNVGLTSQQIKNAINCGIVKAVNILQEELTKKID